MVARAARYAANLAGQVHYHTGKPCKNGHIADRLTSNGACVICVLESDRRPENRAKAAAYRADNVDKLRAYGKVYGAAHREQKQAYDQLYRTANHEKKSARDKAYQAAQRMRDLERVKALARVRMRKWREKNAEAVAARRRAFKRAHPELMLKYSNARRARMLGAEGSFTEADIVAIRKAQRNRCAYCPRSLKAGYHIDHIQPLSKGGTNYPRNLQLTCPKCNQRKHARDALEFSQSLGRLL